MTYIQEIKGILAEARRKTYSAINSAMVEAYWKIGERIVNQEQQGADRAAYGEALLKELSSELSVEFGKGFSYSNLYNMRQFYLTYPAQEIFYTVCGKLSWSHHRLIMRIEDEKARNFYLSEAEGQSWSVRQLERNINTFYYQRLLSSGGGKENLSAKKSDMPQITDFIKDPYVFEFLNIPEPVSATEKEIETALIDKLQHFLLEMGKGYTFFARQYRISTETDHFYIDLVFYNYLLKCFVLIDLKAGGLKHQDIGQMDMYRRMFDDLKKPEGDNPTIGIILCADKSETVVKYSVLKDNEKLFATKFMPYLPTEEELARQIEAGRRQIEDLTDR
ncbi:PDDEXK nuclease domain-containing protein [Bacteroides thetaiotaomicron]|uniref:PDDEXK nuclease domain-containing protein n=1 Tax=Bacteroides thetaiotaomicron TaxID=818 RepID=UPI00101DDDCE|nr:PDDEXK nuclease domain-containing protein [Parabacteroides goldsteinii]